MPDFCDALAIDEREETSMREVTVVSRSERFWTWFWGLVFGFVFKPRNFLIICLLVAAWSLVQQYGGFVGGLLSAALFAAVAALWYWWNVRRYTRGMQQLFATRNELARKIGVSQWDEMHRCVTDITELVVAGVGEEDIKREVLLGEKYPRPVALAALELSQIREPVLPFPLTFLEAKLLAPITEASDEAMQVIADEGAEAMFRGESAENDPN